MAKCLDSYPTAADFLRAFKSDNCRELTRDERRAYMCGSPALWTARAAYGEEAVESWIESQVYAISEYSNCQVKLSVDQIEELSRLILDTYGYLTTTQLMLFFKRFKSAQYGRFYGSVDPLVIGEALLQFKDDHDRELAKYMAEAEKEAQRAQSEAHDAEVRKFRRKLAERGMTLDDYVRIGQSGLVEFEDIARTFELEKSNQPTNQPT